MSSVFREVALDKITKYLSNKSNHELIEIIHKMGLMEDKDTISYILCIASKFNLQDLLNQMINKGVTSDKYRYHNAMVWAVNKNCYECLEILIQNGGDVNLICHESEPEPLIYRAVSSNSTKCLKILLQYKTKINIPGQCRNEKYDSLLEFARIVNNDCQKIIEDHIKEINDSWWSYLGYNIE